MPAAPTAPARHRRSALAVVAELVGYVGLALLAGALLVAVSGSWGALTRPERMAVLLGPGLLVAVVAVVAARLSGDETLAPGPRRRFVGVLVAADAVLVAAGGVQVLRDPDALALPSALAAAGAVAYACWRAGATHLLLLGSGCWLAVTVVADVRGGGTPETSAALGAVAATWLLLALVRVVAEPALAAAAAGALAGAAAQLLAADATTRELGWLGLAVVAAVWLVAYAAGAPGTALAVGALAVVALVPQVVLDVAGDALGAAGALLVVGLTALAASAAVLVLRARRTRAALTA